MRPFVVHYIKANITLVKSMVSKSTGLGGVQGPTLWLPLDEDEISGDFSTCDVEDAIGSAEEEEDEGAAVDDVVAAVVTLVVDDARVRVMGEEEVSVVFGAGGVCDFWKRVKISLTLWF